MAWGLTDLENWRTHAEHQQSLFLKLCAFDLFDAYAACFIAAFLKASTADGCIGYDSCASELGVQVIT